jgi:hypothetical protein
MWLVVAELRRLVLGFVPMLGVLSKRSSWRSVTAHESAELSIVPGRELLVMHSQSMCHLYLIAQVFLECRC